MVGKNGYPHVYSVKQKKKKTPGYFIINLFKKYVIANIILKIVHLYKHIKHENNFQSNGAPSVGIFLGDPSLYLHKFRRKPLKTPNS